MLKRGDQIACMPLHADGKLNHQDVEFGFVTSVRGDVAFCRYWRKGEPGVLRTKANSEGTPMQFLKRHQSVDQKLVDQKLAMIEADYDNVE